MDNELFPPETVLMDSPRLASSSHFKSIIPIGSVYGRWTVISQPVKSRMDNAVGYQPGNCRWATRRQQQENRRCTRWIFINGARITIAEASRRFGVKYGTIARRIRSGWAHDRAVTKPEGGIPLWNEENV